MAWHDAAGAHREPTFSRGRFRSLLGDGDKTMTDSEPYLIANQRISQYQQVTVLCRRRLPTAQRGLCAPDRRKSPHRILPGRPVTKNEKALFQ
eukprot:scaffold257727_cov40-Prasinocladus_malaysianus.AAC.1